VPLIREGDRWELDFAGLEAAFAAGARAYLLCNPHNPTGRVFSAADLGRIAALADRYDVLVVAGSATIQRLLGRLPESCQYGAGLFGVLASLAAWSSGADWLDALLGQLDHARAEFGRLLGERLPGARYVPPEASVLAWVDCAGLGLGPEPAEVFLDRGRVALGRGLNFGAPGDGFVRVTIGTSSALLSAIVDRMAAAAGLAGAEEAAG
jgi:cystathionine beta-lyase